VRAETLPNTLARRLFLERHALLEPPAGPAKGAALAGLIDRLGFVQVDSVNTLARAHDLILWSRRPSYRPASLRWVNDRARATFEHWTHDASIVPMGFYPHWRLRFRRDRDRLHGRWKDWHGDRFHGELDRILAHVAEHGPVSSAEFSGERAEKSTGWWDWHPSKTALEYLWRSGDLVVTRREGFRKLYDLSERVVPPEVLNARHPDLAETVDWACTAALDRLGFATSGELAAFFDLIRPAEAKEWVADARASGRVIDVDVGCADGSTRRSVAWPGVVEAAEALSEPGPRMRVLSPFDPALRDRKRAERLFGFHYRIEIFVPEAKRRYGYYVFPVLEGTRLAGRIDMAAEAGRTCLTVRAFWPEPGVRMGTGRIRRLSDEITRLAGLAGCGDVAFAPNWLRGFP
jgi:uncharacterized protein YcaQ